jgi:hypothetical protein
MNTDLQNLEPKVENEGTTPQGKLSAAEWNILLAAVKLLDQMSSEESESLTIGQVANYLAEEGYAKIEDINEAISKLPVGITQSQLVAYLTENKYATQTYVDNAVANVPSGGGGITEGDLGNYLSTNGYATQTWVNENRWVKPITTVTANRTLTEEDCMVVITASTRVTITLPNIATKGRSYEIFGRNSAGMILKSGRAIYRAQGSSSTSHTITAGYFHAMVTYDGSFWLLSITENS